ncbi:hypothetical protein V1292_000819 [Bradyrhizobium sp. AZCC 1719]
MMLIESAVPRAEPPPGAVVAATIRLDGSRHPFNIEQTFIQL